MANRIFISGIDVDEYDAFVRSHQMKSHFLQSSTWGNIQERKGYVPYYLALKEGKKIIAATLLLQRKLPFNYCYFYAPRGFVLDYDKKDVLKEFTAHVASFVKSKKGIFFRIDPDVIYHEYNKDNEIIKDRKENTIADLKSLKYKHRGFTQNFETEQPRFTFRMHLENTMEEIFKNMSSTTRQRIKKAEKYNVDVKVGTIDDIETFISLMEETEHRKEFSSHDKEYYRYFYKIFNEKENAKLFLGSVNPRKIVSILETDLLSVKHELSLMEENVKTTKSYLNKKQELLKQQENILREIKTFQEYGLEYQNDVVISAHMIVYFGTTAWVLYAGNSNKLSTTYANYKVYYEHIKYAKENGILIYDQFGTIGVESKDESLYGLHDFKKKFGGVYTEFIGEFDYVTNRFMYFLFQKLVPEYRKIKRKLRGANARGH